MCKAGGSHWTAEHPEIPCMTSAAPGGLGVLTPAEASHLQAAGEGGRHPACSESRNRLLPRETAWCAQLKAKHHVPSCVSLLQLIRLPRGLPLAAQFRIQRDNAAGRAGSQLLSRPALSSLWIPFVTMASSMFFWQKAGWDAERDGGCRWMMATLLLCRDRTPGYRLGTTSQSTHHSKSCGSPAGVLPTHLPTLSHGTASQRGSSSWKPLPLFPPSSGAPHACATVAPFPPPLVRGCCSRRNSTRSPVPWIFLS